VIRFSAFLVAVALGLLVAGAVTSKLLLVYLAIGISGVALLALAAGAAFKWSELFGKPQTAEPAVSGFGRSGAVPSFVPDAQPEAREPARIPAAPVRSTSSSTSPWPAASVPATPPLAGYLPTDQPASRSAAAQPWGSGPPRPTAFPEPAAPAVPPVPAVEYPAVPERPAAASPGQRPEYVRPTSRVRPSSPVSLSTRPPRSRSPRAAPLARNPRPASASQPLLLPNRPLLPPRPHLMRPRSQPRRSCQALPRSR